MKILAIRIKNLASLSGDTVIDFTTEPLASAGIFAITGPTGSGKSTILDALCLALYGKTPRYRLAENGIEVQDVGGNKINQGDVRGILRDGAAEGFAEVDFVGVDGGRYRAKWSVRRARNRAEGALQQAETGLTNINTGVVVPGRKTELQSVIERLVGLNFEQFTRSVLLAQGDFTAFLKANKEEKSSLLEKLTGTQVYTAISRQVFVRHREEEQRLRDLELRRGEIRTLTTEEVEALGLEKGELEARVQREQAAANALSDGISWYEQLNLLQTSRDAAYEDQREVLEEQQAAQPRVRYLDRVERVQAVGPAVDKQNHLREELAEKRDLLLKQEGALEGLRSKQDTVSEVVQQAEGNLVQRSEEQEGAQAGLDRAKALDVELEGKAKQLKQANEELQTVVRKQGELTGTLEARRKEAADVDGEIIRLDQWKAENTGRQALAVNESLIFSRLKDATTWLEKQVAVEKALQQTGQEKERVEKERDGLRVEEEAKASALQKAQEELEKNQAALSGLWVELLEKDKAVVDNALVELSDASALWDRLYTIQQEMERITAKLGEQERALETGRQGLADAERELGTAGVQKDVARKALERMQLAVSGDVKGMRAQLVEDEPCPVCGSTHHPYATENPQLDGVLAGQLEMVREYERAHLKWGEEQGRLKGVVGGLIEEVESLKAERAERELRLQEREKDWVGCAVYEEAMKTPTPDRAGWIRERWQSERDKQVRLQKELESAHRLQQQVAKDRDNRDRLEKETTEMRDGIKDQVRALELIGERLIYHNKELLQVGQGLEEIEAQLTGYFSSGEWFAGWKANPKEVEKGILEAIGEWKANEGLLEKYRVDQKTLAVTMGNHEVQLVEMGEDRQRREEWRDELDGQYASLREQRAELFAGRAVVDVERELKLAVDAARKVLEAGRVEKEEIGKAATRALTEKEQNEAAIGKAEEGRVAVEGVVREWLAVYNREQGEGSGEEGMSEEGLSVEDLERLLAITPAWRRGEQAALRELDDKVMRAETVLKEREQALAGHGEQGRPEQAVEELGRLLAETTASLQETTRRLNEIDFHLEEDREHKKRIGELLREIEAQNEVVENWAKLNEVVGSFDGRKFRQVAQEYTLDVLIRFSNVQLSRLSSRYVLQRVPESLGLQVVDQDMGNEVRTVFSLSGGESFLVSLSLALGLASLTSSRMRVESLFIDEGFGSLDPNTLNIAMDALERLHQQGRKVGVISHVQEMTERIGVQIQVRKERSGRSRVEVVGI